MAKRQSMQKNRSEGDRERARARGGDIRSTPAEPPPGRSASTGGHATRGMTRNSMNSRSSNSGRDKG